jgi:hypothetical protein
LAAGFLAGAGFLAAGFLAGAGFLAAGFFAAAAGFFAMAAGFVAGAAAFVAGAAWPRAARTAASTSSAWPFTDTFGQCGAPCRRRSSTVERMMPASACRT